jgi:tight adherence protein C
MGKLIDFLFDPAVAITAVSGAAAFMALLGVLMPYLRPDPMRGRLKATTERRRDLRAQRMEAIQKRSKLRRARPSRVRDLVDRLKIRDLFARDDLKRKLLQANWRSPNAVSLFVFARVTTPLAFGGIAALLLYGGDKFHYAATTKAAITGIAVIAGFFLPTVLVINAIQRRQAAFTSAFPDALDLLLICVESGLSIESAFSRVAQEIGSTTPELAEEFDLTTAELAYLPDRRQALDNLVLRTGLPSVKAVCTTLVQADKYGTPLASALRIAAQENRDRRMAAAEKKAGSLPAKLTVPMIVFFLPVLFIVILGPAIIQAMTR